MKSKNLWKLWSWYSVLDSIAEGDRFRSANQSKMEGAMTSNFYEAMIWLAKVKHFNSINY